MRCPPPFSNEFRNVKKRILEQLCNSSPSTLQVIVALWVTAVIHSKTLVTHSSPKSLYLVENVRFAMFIHSSPTRHLFRMTSELAMQLILYQNDIPLKGDEWVTSETK